nr:DnaA-like replication initiator protein [Rickettsia endosymbiont of Ixodes pacificus]
MTLPHIEQKHNSKHLFLQHIGNLPYHQDKSATSYDSINSCTTHNNHYTLLYPDLVQELFNFSLHNSNSTINISHSLSSLDVNNSEVSSLDSSLSPRDILFFLQIVSLYQLELSKGNSSITYPSLKLAKILGVDASCDTGTFLGDANMRATILKMTAKLESLGLLKVFRRKRKNGMNKANKLIPVLPDRLYARIKHSPANLKISDSSKLEHESTVDHILRTKLFVPIELEFMKSLFKNNLPSKYKLFFLNCIISAYRNFRHNSSSSNSRAYKDTNSSFYDSQGNFIDLTNKLSFSATSRELMRKNDISRSTLDRIFRYIKQQGDRFFIQVEHKYTKSDDIDCNRYDKSIFVISINPLVFPISQIKQSQKEEISNINHDELQDANSSTFPDTYEVFKTVWSKKQPSIIKKTALNNKDIIIKNKYSKNIDYIDENCEDFENSSVDNSQSRLREPPTTKNTATNHEEEFFEDKLGLSSSEFYNNSSFFDKEVLEKEPQQKNQKEKLQNKQKEEWQELRHFYPLSEKDVNLLNSRANREFSTNFINQLLLKLYIKYPEKRFKNRFMFLSYMVQILANEKHQGPLVNHTTFRFSCNIGTEEKNLLEYEKYLSEIENSFDTTKETLVRKKIAGRFSTEVAYKILTQVEFKQNHDNSFVTVLIPNHLALSEQQIEILSQQLEAVYGINGYYVQVLEDVGYSQKGGGIDTIEESTEEPIAQTFSKTQQGVSLGAILSTTAWYQIRHGLIEELGEAIDTAWFSKAIAVECTETYRLTLIMPTRFMADWIRNNYSHVIKRLSGECGIKRLEYRF